MCGPVRLQLDYVDLAGLKGPLAVDRRCTVAQRHSDGEHIGFAQVGDRAVTLKGVG